MTDDLPDNVDLNWIGRTLLGLRADVAELKGDMRDLQRMRGEDRSLLEDVAREAGIEPTGARLSREQFEKDVRERLDRLEAKVFPPAE